MDVGGSRQVRGRSLHDVLHDPGNGIAQQAVIPLDPSRVVLIARSILTALGGGAVHGYISPHTILLTDDGRALLVGDRVAPGATAANDLFALGMALFEAVEGRAPHPAEPLPPMANAGPLAPLIEALTRREAAERPDAGAALRLLEESLAAAAASAAAAAAAASAAAAAAASAAAARADATETRDLPQVPAGDAAGAGGSAGAGGAGSSVAAGGSVAADGLAGAGGLVGAGGSASADTSLLPRIPTPPTGPPHVGHAPYDDTAYPPPTPPSFSVSPSARKNLIIGGSVAAAVVTAAVALGVAQPWHRTDTSSSTVPGVPAVASTSGPGTPAAATPSTSAPATPATTPGTPTPTPTPTVSAPTALVSMSLCLDAATTGGVHSGAKVTAVSCHGSPNEAWQLHTDGTIHSMADAGLCLDAAAPSGKVLNGAQVTAWTCHGGPNQDWVWKADGTVSPAANAGLCLDAAGPVPSRSGANVTAWPCNNGANEHWAKQ
jgi:hypothetical protein